MNNRVMALDWGQSSVSAQYLENKWVEFDQILHVHWGWQYLGWDYYISIWCKFLTELWPLIDVRISFRLSILTHFHWETSSCVFSLFSQETRLRVAYTRSLGYPGWCIITACFDFKTRLDFKTRHYICVMESVNKNWPRTCKKMVIFGQI